VSKERRRGGRATASLRQWPGLRHPARRWPLHTLPLHKHCSPLLHSPLCLPLSASSSSSLLLERMALAGRPKQLLTSSAPPMSRPSSVPNACAGWASRECLTILVSARPSRRTEVIWSDSSSSAARSSSAADTPARDGSLPDGAGAGVGAGAAAEAMVMGRADMVWWVAGLSVAAPRIAAALSGLQRRGRRLEARGAAAREDLRPRHVGETRIQK
jgi:hypothetical protein